MLSDEEKKAIEIIKFLQYKCIEENGTGMMHIYRIDDLAKAIETLLNLIEKQSKEIEELKEIYQTGYVNGCVSKVYEINKKWEDKIKAKIEELDKEIKVKREIAKNPMDRVSGRLLTDSIVELEKTKKVLQSLLEKE